MSTFSQPSAPSGGINWSDHKGALILIEPLSFEAQIPTAFGAADAVKANVYVIDGPGAPASYEEALIFPKLLASQTKSKIGEKILGRLAQGLQKPGQSPPWLLEPAPEADVTKAEAWVAGNTKPAVTSAAPPF